MALFNYWVMISKNGERNCFNSKDAREYSGYASHYFLVFGQVVLLIEKEKVSDFFHTFNTLRSCGRR
jgi:hypothetical protein